MEQVRSALSPLGLLSEDYETPSLRMWGNFPQAYSTLVSFMLPSLPRPGGPIFCESSFTHSEMKRKKRRVCCRFNSVPNRECRAFGPAHSHGGLRLGRTMTTHWEEVGCGGGI